MNALSFRPDPPASWQISCLLAIEKIGEGIDSALTSAVRLLEGTFPRSKVTSPHPEVTSLHPEVTYLLSEVTSLTSEVTYLPSEVISRTSEVTSPRSEVTSLASEALLRPKVICPPSVRLAAGAGAA
jgi:hypothetical protein